MGKLLLCKEDIMAYIHCSRSMFKTWIKRGLPARNDDGRWCAHTDNIDEFLKEWTKPEVKA